MVNLLLLIQTTASGFNDLFLLQDWKGILDCGSRNDGGSFVGLVFPQLKQSQVPVAHNFAFMRSGSVIGWIVTGNQFSVPVPQPLAVESADYAAFTSASNSLHLSPDAKAERKDLLRCCLPRWGLGCARLVRRGKSFLRTNRLFRPTSPETFWFASGAAAPLLQNNGPNLSLPFRQHANFGNNRSRNSCSNLCLTGNGERSRLPEKLTENRQITKSWMTKTKNRVWGKRWPF